MGYTISRDPSAGIVLDLTSVFAESADGKFISIYADGDDVYILAGPDGTVQADPAAVAGDKQCVVVGAGTERPFHVHTDSIFLSCKSSGTKACKVRIYLSSYG